MGILHIYTWCVSMLLLLSPLRHAPLNRGWLEFLSSVVFCCERIVSVRGWGQVSTCWYNRCRRPDDERQRHLRTAMPFHVKQIIKTILASRRECRIVRWRRSDKFSTFGSFADITLFWHFFHERAHALNTLCRYSLRAIFVYAIFLEQETNFITQIIPAIADLFEGNEKLHY